jgi:2-hydroxy-6-oxonona-2,4-dienedioate hydrolase
VTRIPNDLTEDATSRFVQVPDEDRTLQLHCHDTGGSGEPVVMIHGSGPGASGWSNFHRNVQPLAEAGCRVVLMDCPGWGRSDPVVCTGSRAELNARALLGLLDALGLERAHLVGNSMGAHSAVAFALAHPHRVGKMVLMGGGTGGVSSFVPMPTEGIKLINTLYRNPTLENLKRMMQVFVYDPGALTEDLLQGRLRNMLARPDHLQNFVRSSELNPRQYADVGARLGEVATPTLVIWGRDDRFVPLDVGLRLVAGLKDADLHVFSRCGHWAQWEHADKFNRTVADFIAH